MKTTITSLFIIAIILFFSACHNDENAPEIEPFVLDCSKYPLPGYYEFGYEAAPDKVLDTISTSQLLLSCLHFDEYWMTVSSSGKFLEIIYDKFERLEFTSELIKRENAHCYIYERYLCVGSENFGFLIGRYYFHLELFLLYPPVFSKFSDEEKIDILNKAILTYENYYTQTGTCSGTSAILAWQILLSFNYQPVVEFRDSIDGSDSLIFLEYGFYTFVDEEDMNKIIEFAKDFLKNK